MSSEEADYQELKVGNAPKEPAKLSALYQETILNNYRSPSGRGMPLGMNCEGSKLNPLCGDEIRIGINLEGDRIEGIGFEGRGCSITTASASILTKTVSGMNCDDVIALIEKLERAPHNNDVSQGDWSGDMHVLASAARWPQRLSCVLTPWLALKEALRNHTNSCRGRKNP